MLPFLGEELSQILYGIKMNKIIKDGLFFIAGPCVIESRDLIMQTAQSLKTISQKLGIELIFKSSFDKANRTSISSFRGPGLDEGLKILQEVKQTFDIAIITDIHEPNQAKSVGEVVDIIQIPAFLCRQTDLLVRAAQTNKIVNVKKAQFLSYEDMPHVINKLKEAGNEKIILTERGTSFGYQNLVVDYRNVIEMTKLGYPVVMDATHSTQRPGGASGVSGGNSDYAIFLAKNALVCGARGLFFETHPDLSQAKSDASNMLRLDLFEQTALECKNLYDFLH